MIWWVLLKMTILSSQCMPNLSWTTPREIKMHSPQEKQATPFKSIMISHLKQRNQWVQAELVECLKLKQPTTWDDLVNTAVLRWVPTMTSQSSTNHKTLTTITTTLHSRLSLAVSVEIANLLGEEQDVQIDSSSTPTPRPWSPTIKRSISRRTIRQ